MFTKKKKRREKTEAQLSPTCFSLRWEKKGRKRKRGLHLLLQPFSLDVGAKELGNGEREKEKKSTAHSITNPITIGKGKEKKKRKKGKSPESRRRKRP